jgi:molybdate transport system ATP-binding protein
MMPASSAKHQVYAHLRLQRGEFVLDAQLEFPHQGVTALFGPSGSGKSTLLRAIAGLEPDAVGDLEVGATFWQNRKMALPAHKRPVGYVFQEADLFQHLNVRDNLLFGYRRVAARDRRLDLADIVPRLGLEHLLDRAPQGLSGGERQRVAIGRALLTSPQLLLLDEPLSALDKKSKGDILPYLESLRDFLSIPILYVTHSHEEVARLADYLVLIHQGRITEHGPAPQLINRLDSPLTAADDRFSIVSCTLHEQVPEYQLSRLTAGETQLMVPFVIGEIGRHVRLRIQARDVSVCLTKPQDSSILNIVPVEVCAIAPAEVGQRLLLLRNDDLTLIARISELSFQQLNLCEGQHIYAQVKSIALVHP